MKQKMLCKYFFIHFFIFLFVISGCNKDNSTNPESQSVQITISQKDVMQTSITVAGSIKNYSGEEITARGVCWNTANMPTINDYTTSDGNGPGEFTSSLLKLKPDILYYIRGYATTKSGTIYGSQIVIKTSSSQLANLTTSDVTEISYFSAMAGGNVISDGNGELYEKGLCWGTTPSPTFPGNLTTTKNISFGAGKGSFSYKLTDLKKNTQYYVRAYALNPSGIAYGNEITFKTPILIELPKAMTMNVSAITLSTAIIKGAVTSNGDGIITERGVCWNTGGTPTINDDKLIDENEENPMNITGTITDLKINTTYYVCAYCINNAGIGYGEIISFKTENTMSETVTDIDGNVYHTVKIGNQVWLAENLKTTKYRDGSPISNIKETSEWNNLKTGAYCDYENKPEKSNSYGRLYNWYAAIDSRNIAPTGWRVPANSDWETLMSYLGGASVAGGKLKQAGLINWSSPNGGATNETGFTGLPAGIRDSSYSFEYLYDYGYFWTSTPDEYKNTARHWLLSYRRADLGRSVSSKNNGYSIRCIREN
jgi:uncharacterized protein (TIGR02145 family)